MGAYFVTPCPVSVCLPSLPLSGLAPRTGPSRGVGLESSVFLAGFHAENESTGRTLSKSVEVKRERNGRSEGMAERQRR